VKRRITKRERIERARILVALGRDIEAIRILVKHRIALLAAF